MRQWATLPDPIASGHPRIILNISASPFWAGKCGLCSGTCSAAIARRHSAYVVMVNQVGGNDSLIFDGSSLAIGPNGEVIAQAASFAEDLVVIDTDAQPSHLLCHLESVKSAARGYRRHLVPPFVLGTRD